MRPLLLIDVDGVLNPSMSNSEAKRRGFMTRHAHDSHGWRYRLFLHNDHGRWLKAMTDQFELVWATTWEHTANVAIGPKIGLPELPVVEFDFVQDQDSKVPGIVRFTQGRPFVWLDDDATDYDRELLEQNPKGLLIDIDHRVGLTPEHLEAARSWANAL